MPASDFAAELAEGSACAGDAAYARYPQPVNSAAREVLDGHLRWLAANADLWLSREKGPSLAMVSDAVLKTVGQLSVLERGAPADLGAMLALADGELMGAAWQSE